VTSPVDVLGTVVRLQVQRSRLKPGPRSTRVYDPAPLLEVPALELEPRGAVGLVDGQRIVDVHHADHPDSRHRGLNGLSLLPRSHYDRLRARFGDHLLDGIAGESLLLETEHPWTVDDLVGELVLETADGELLTLGNPVVAAPCLEFTRFCLRREPGRVDEQLTSALEQLDGGARGFYVTATGTGRVEPAARLLRR
jgi:hypothetical protein